MRKSFNTVPAEYMGIFGFSWEEKVASFIKMRLKGTEVGKKLSSFWQAGGMNVTLIKNLHNEYMALMAKGVAPSGFSVQPDDKGNGGTYSASTVSLAGKIAASTNADNSVVLEFLRALYVLSRDGKIPMAKWNPAGYKESTDLRKSFSTEKTVLDTITKTASTVADKSKIILAVAAIGAAAYFLSQAKAFAPARR